MVATSQIPFTMQRQALHVLCGVIAAHICWSIIGKFYTQEQMLGPNGSTEIEPYLVICTRMRNEAPYLREWIEFHRLIGFDKIFLVNDKSTDDTGCILDAYNSSQTEDDNLVWKVDPSVKPRWVFEECSRIILEEPEFDASNTWMMTHDLDEFLWFDSKEFRNLKEAIVHFSSWHEGEVKSIQIPRLLFGTSGHKYPDPQVMIQRFTHRFDPKACPANTTVNSCNTYNYCSRKYDDPITNVKSISLVSEIAQNCFSMKKVPGKKEKISEPDHCMSTHYHEIVDPALSSGEAQLVDARKSKRAVYLKATETHDRTIAELGKEDSSRGGIFLWDKIMVAHYYLKSREEFFSRICDSRFNTKYYEHEGCTPATNFETLEVSAGVLEDRRLADLNSFEPSRLLETQLIKTAPRFAHCNGRPVNRRPLEEYNECWESQRRDLEGNDD